MRRSTILISTLLAAALVSTQAYAVSVGSGNGNGNGNVGVGNGNGNGNANNGAVNGNGNGNGNFGFGNGNANGNGNLGAGNGNSNGNQNLGAGNGNVNVNLDRLLVFNNAQGVTFNSTGMSGGQITATVANSTFGSSQTGLTTSGTVPVFTTLIRSAISNNAGFGIITAGSGSQLKFGYSTITGNEADFNAVYGIEAVPGVRDGGGNRARGNGNVAQCSGVACGA